MLSASSSRRRSLGRQFTLLVAAGVTGVVLTVAVASYAISRHTLLRDVDAALLTSAQEVAADPIPGQAFSGDDPGKPLRSGPGGLGGALQLLDRTGAVITPIGSNSTSVELPIDASDREIAASGVGVSYRDATVNGQPTRLITVGARSAGAVQEARSLADVNATLRGLLLLLLATLAVGLLLAVAVGTAVSRAGLRPIRKISEAARTVARTEDLSALIPETGPDDIADIARSVNTILRSLDLSRARQRQLVDDASHELRTPLSSLRTNIELLTTLQSQPGKRAALTRQDHAEILTDLADGLQELDDLVATLTELARHGSTAPVKEDIQVSLLAAQAVARARLRGPRAQIRSTVPADLRLSGDPVSLERALVNLLDKALKFGPADGAVTVRAGPGYLEVSDEGPGIDPADEQAIFGRFYRAGKTQNLPGSGLGLAMVAETAREHGGRAAVEPSASGTTVRMSLPGLHT